MNPPSKISTLAAIFGLSLAIWSYSPPLKAATINMDSGMMDMDSSMMDMDLGPADAQYDLRFIDNMSMHHQDAITMALDALYKTERGEIRQLSQDIISSQSSEIAQLQEWRQAWYPNASPVAAVPEPPATLGLLAFGAFGIASVLKRNRQGAA